MAVFSGKFEKVVLIVSNGRTGTKAIAQHLDRCYDNVRALHEPPPSWRLRIASIKAFSGHISKAELVEMLVRHRRQLVEQIDRPIYIESNPLLQGFIEAFGEVFENPMIVHVVRDPRTFVRSSINFGALSGVKRLASTFYPYWLPKPEHFDARCERRWSDMRQVERMAWFWRIVNTALNRGEAIYGHKYLRITFEELFAKDGSGLDRLTDWIGLPRSPALREEANRENVNASRKEVLPRWEQWSAEDQQNLLRHCGELMQLYGYPVEPPPQRVPPTDGTAPRFLSSPA